MSRRQIASKPCTDYWSMLISRNFTIVRTEAGNKIMMIPHHRHLRYYHLDNPWLHYIVRHRIHRNTENRYTYCEMRVHSQSHALPQIRLLPRSAQLQEPSTYSRKGWAQGRRRHGPTSCRACSRPVSPRSPHPSPCLCGRLCPRMPRFGC